MTNAIIELGPKEREILQFSGVQALNTDELTPEATCGLCGDLLIIGDYVIDAGSVWNGMDREYMHFTCWSKEKDELP
jgi:hypothetical protein